jgi:ribonuclease BN (tRNA processing enzyme)
MDTSLGIRFVGTGGAFDVELGNSAAIVSMAEANYLVDCGHSVFPRLVQLGLVSKIDGILITHLHDDHVGSLSSLVLYHSLVLQKGRMKIYVPSADFQASLSALLSHSLGDPSCALIFDPFLRSRELVLSIPSGSTSNGCRPTLIISRTEKAALSIQGTMVM